MNVHLVNVKRGSITYSSDTQFLRKSLIMTAWIFAYPSLRWFRLHIIMKWLMISRK